MSLVAIDRQRVQETLQIITKMGMEQIFEMLLPAKEEHVRILCESCTFNHAALLVFCHVTEAQSFLETIGVSIKHQVPSVLVRERLRKRYDLEDIDVQILSGGSLELFVFQSPASKAMMEQERSSERESHFCFQPLSSTDVHTILRILTDDGFCEDGWGSNPHIGRNLSLYFMEPQGGRRIEIQVKHPSPITDIITGGQHG